MKLSPRRNACVRSVRLVVACAALVSLACGYGTNTRTAKDIKSIYVPFFTNKTAEPNLEITFTDGIIQSLVNDNTLKVVPETGADATLDGEIVSFKDLPFSFNNELDADEYHLTITVSCTLFNRRTNEPIWQHQQFVGTGSYFLEGTVGRTRADAMDQAIEQIRDRILNLTVQDW